MAISRGHREVIRVLLENKNWRKLIRQNNIDQIYGDENNDDDCETKLTLITHANHSHVKYIENPQLCALFDNKMWDMFKIVLDKCITNGNDIDFSVIDPPIKSMGKHLLMLIALRYKVKLL